MNQAHLKHSQVSSSQSNHARNESSLDRSLGEERSLSDLRPPQRRGPNERAVRDFTRVVRERLAATSTRDSWEAAPNVVDKFLRIKRELRQSGHEDSVYTDSRVIGMFFTPRYFPTRWERLTPVEKTEIISAGLKRLDKELEHYQVALLNPSQKRALKPSHPTPTRESTPQSPSPAKQPNPASRPTTSSRNVAHGPAPRAEPFSWAILNLKVGDLPTTKNSFRFKEAFRHSQGIDTLLDLLNLPADKLYGSLKRFGIGAHMLREEMASVHPAVAVLISDLSALGLPKSMAHLLTSQTLSQIDLIDGRLTPVPTREMRKIDNGFRLAAAPIEMLRTLPAEELQKIREVLRQSGL